MKNGGWLDKYEQGGLVLKQKTHDNYGKKPNANYPEVTLPPGFVGQGYNIKGRNYSPAWGGQFQNGGWLEKYADDAQNGDEVTYTHNPSGSREAYMLKRTVTPYTSKRDIRKKTQTPTDPRQVNFLSNYTGSLGDIKNQPSAVEFEGDKHWNIDRFIMDPAFGHGYPALESGQSKKGLKKNVLADMYKYYMLQGQDKDDAFRNAKQFMRQEINPRLNSKYFKEASRLTGVHNEPITNFADENPFKRLRDINNQAESLRSNLFYKEYFENPLTEREMKQISKSYLKNFKKMSGKESRKKVKEWIKETNAPEVHFQPSGISMGQEDYRDGGNLMPPMAGADQTVPMAQTGTRQPIYTSNLDRVKSYQDSVSLYNQGKANYDRGVKAHDEYVASLPLEHQQYYTKQPSYEQAPSRLYTLTGKDLEKYLKEENFRSGFHQDFSDKFFLKNRNNPIKPTHLQVIEGIVNQAFYKKPVQPVIYKKRTLERPNLDVDLPEIELEALPQPDMEYRSAAANPRMISETPTKYSYTYPSGNEQKTIYFPSKSSWKAFTEQYDGLSTEERAGSFSASPGTYSQLRRPNPAFGDLKFAMGGSLPGAVGFTYARVSGAAPANGPYAKKTKASAQNGQEMSFYQHGLDWKPKNISRNGNWLDKFEEGGEIIKDNEGYWNPENWGKPVEIGSNEITMEGVLEPLLGVSDTGDTQMMYPGKNYTFSGTKVVEYPREYFQELGVAKDGKSVNRADEYPLEKLDNLLNFTNYNKPQKAKSGKWLDKYQ
jgi:hypothetical protein